MGGVRRRGPRASGSACWSSASSPATGSPSTARTGPAWLLADLGAQGIGAVTVGVYPTSPAAEVEYLLAHSEAVVLIAEDEEQLDKALAVRDKLPQPALDRRRSTRGASAGIADDPMLMTFAELEALGERRTTLDDWARRVERLEPSEPAIIVYTSGTTGPPKGAMLTHANLLAAADIFKRTFEVSPDDEVLSYLPLCHVAERLISVIDAAGVGLRRELRRGRRHLRDRPPGDPAHLLPRRAPRVGEDAGRHPDPHGRRLAAQAGQLPLLARAGRDGMRPQAHGRAALGLGGRIAYALGWLFLYRSLRKKLGLARVRVALSGAAPIAPQVLEFFWALGVPVGEGYGQTESTALATFTPPDDVRIGKVGKALPGVELRIADDGEILVRGPGVFLGYLKNDEGHHGDDRRRRLAAHRRRRRARRRRLPHDHRPQEGHHHHRRRQEHLAVGDREQAQGLALRPRGDRHRRPPQVPHRPHRHRARHRRQLGHPAGHRLHHLRATCRASPRCASSSTTWVDQVNAELAQVEQIKRFALLPKELDHEEGELTATQKVKRAAIAKEFEPLIEGMYTAHERVERERLPAAAWSPGCRASGALYALVALGFVIIYKATGVINFAQGALLLLGAYLALSFHETAGTCRSSLAALAGHGRLRAGRRARRAAHPPPHGRPARLRRDHDHDRPDDRHRADRDLALGRQQRNLGDPWGLDTFTVGDVVIPVVNVVRIVAAAVLLAAFFAFFRYSRSAWPCGPRPSTRRRRWPRASAPGASSPCRGRSRPPSPRWPACSSPAAAAASTRPSASSPSSPSPPSSSAASTRRAARSSAASSSASSRR